MFFQEVRYRLDPSPFGLFFRNWGLSIDVRHIGVCLVYDVGVYPALSSHTLASTYQHIYLYSSNLSSI